MSSDSGVRRRTKPVKVIEREENETKKVHQSIGWFKAVCISTVLSFAILPLVLWLIPSPIDPVPFTLPRPRQWTGALAPNKKLERATRLYNNKILGPESLVADGEYLYTGTADGRVVVIHKGEIRDLTRFGQLPCGRFEDEPTCGRPLGMRIDKDGYLIVVDTYLGLFKVNVVTGDKTLLLSPSVPINGRVPKFMNDLDIGPDDTIYISDSSTKWDRRHNRYAIMEGESSGRLFSYNPATNTTEELVTGIAFANGVQLTRDKTALLLVSTTKASIYKYYLEGAKKGKLETFVDNLPGLPDNIRRSSLGGFWVGLATVRKPTFSFIDLVSNRPWITRLITKIFSQEILIKLIPKYGMVIHLNEKGEITHSLHDPSGTKVPAVSEVEESGGVLYLGSYNLPFLSKVYLSDIKDKVT